MQTDSRLIERFEANRSRLRAIAYRMLGSVHDADDALQECWIKLSRTDASQIENLAGWLTTATGRVCLDVLRARKSRREEALETSAVAIPSHFAEPPASEAMLAEAVGLALLVVLERLTPTDRLAFVLHDLFGMNFIEIGRILGRSAAAARQIASRARRRVQGAPMRSDADLNKSRKVVDVFLAASRSGDLNALLAVLDPRVVSRVDQARSAGEPTVLRGADEVARQTQENMRLARFARTAMVNGRIGAIVAPAGRLRVVLSLKVTNGRIAVIKAITAPSALRKMRISVLR